MSVGKIISISNMRVEILLDHSELKLRDIVSTKVGDIVYRFEIARIDGSIAMAIPFENVIGLRRGLEVELESDGISMQYSDEILGKVFNSYGDLIDGKTIENVVTKNVYDRNMQLSEIEIDGEILWTELRYWIFLPRCRRALRWVYLGVQVSGKQC